MHVHLRSIPFPSGNNVIGPPLCLPPPPTHACMHRSVPAFFRFLRPATGFGPQDTPYEEFRDKWEPISDAEVFGGDGKGYGGSSALGHK